MTDPTRRRPARRAAVASAGLLAAVCVLGLAARFPYAAGVGLLLLGLLGVRAAVLAVGHARLARRLRQASVPGRVERIGVCWSPIAAAAVAGVCRPAIFINARLPDRLAAAEVRAVALHERGHQLRRDPARLLALAAAPLLQRLPGGRAWLEAARARLEIRADRYALRNGVTRPQLARTLLKLQPTPSLGAACFTSAGDLRLRVLVDPETDLSTSAGSIAHRATLVFVTACALSATDHLAILGMLGCPWMSC